jgi:hypothetical protein
MAVPTAEDVILALALGLNTTPGEENYAINYTSSETCNRLMRIPYELAAGATDQAFALTGLDSLLWYAVIDLSNIGVNVGKAAGAGKLVIRAGQFFLAAVATPLTVYLDNPDGSNISYGEIIALGSST